MFTKTPSKGLAYKMYDQQIYRNNCLKRNWRLFEQVQQMKRKYTFYRKMANYDLKIILCPNLHSSSIEQTFVARGHDKHRIAFVSASYWKFPNNEPVKVNEESGKTIFFLKIRKKLGKFAKIKVISFQS